MGAAGALSQLALGLGRAQQPQQQLQQQPQPPQRQQPAASEPAVPAGGEADDVIGRRTRAHVSLADIDLDELSALLQPSPNSSPPPSPTTAMANSAYLAFLQGIFAADDSAGAAPASAPGAADGEEDDDDDYNYLMDRASEQELPEEFAEMEVDMEELRALRDEPRHDRARRDAAAAALGGRAKARKGDAAQAEPAAPAPAGAAPAARTAAFGNSARPNGCEPHAQPSARAPPHAPLPAAGAAAQPPCAPAPVWTAARLAELQRQLGAHTQLLLQLLLRTRSILPHTLQPRVQHRHNLTEVACDALLASHGLLAELVEHAEAGAAFRRLCARPCYATPLGLPRAPPASRAVGGAAGAAAGAAAQRAVGVLPFPSLTEPHGGQSGSGGAHSQGGGGTVACGGAGGLANAAADGSDAAAMPPPPALPPAPGNGPPPPPALHAPPPAAAGICGSPHSVFAAVCAGQLRETLLSLGPLPLPSERERAGAQAMCSELAERQFSLLDAEQPYAALFDPELRPCPPQPPAWGRDVAAGAAGSDDLAEGRTFSIAEEELLVIGLKRFGPSRLDEVQRRLLPTKAPSQLKERVKSRSSRRAAQELPNPILEWKMQRLGTQFGEYERTLILHTVREHGAQQSTWERISTQLLPAYSATVVREYYHTVLEEPPLALPQPPPPANARRAAQAQAAPRSAPAPGARKAPAAARGGARPFGATPTSAQAAALHARAPPPGAGAAGAQAREERPAAGAAAAAGHAPSGGTGCAGGGPEVTQTAASAAQSGAALAELRTAAFLDETLVDSEPEEEPRHPTLHLVFNEETLIDSDDD